MRSRGAASEARLPDRLPQYGPPFRERGPCRRIPAGTTRAPVLLAPKASVAKLSGPPRRTRVRICAETYGFARQKTRGGSMNLILISWMTFLVDFCPQIAF
jgi:hypothetical protein